MIPIGINFPVFQGLDYLNVESRTILSGLKVMTVGFHGVSQHLNIAKCLLQFWAFYYNCTLEIENVARPLYPLRNVRTIR